MTATDRGRVFGEVAESYHRVRPGYPAELAADLLAEAGPGPVLEVGAGTGKATAGFAALGAELTCLEPDPRMAAVLRRSLPGVRVLETTFESWTPDRAYPLLISAQAWHWVDPARRAALAAAALAPGGLFAPFWNVFFVADPDLHAALTEVNHRHGLAGEHTPHHSPAGSRSPEPLSFAKEWPELHLPGDAFTGMRTLRYRSARSYSADLYREHLLSLSLYRTLPPDRADAVLTDTVAAVEAAGGTIDFVVHTDVALARRR
ncbi:methyltransferase type 11 [Actinoplanes ianthinogenes]|uniref:Methyltransferase type 11 n=1 Tax=Actinoplanes ianthinogenes TaxID=122358 RepID=A0ABM7M066_9ACTN|nr:methyltransferase domain-containing protein [Actinoplanes ianthinogenes]BCJ44961.1 methyltransferase type 11 [Actinoplanes ianthinogenes]GGR52722.1 methyltransferase type 11 [Actinoplanes ianthinogenes]